MRRMVIDTANLLFRIAAVNNIHNSGTPEEKAGLAMHMSLNSLNRYYKKYQPDEIALTFEGRNNWRKAYSKSDQCRSRRVYKANRTKDDSMLPFFELIDSFYELASKHTNLICLQHDDLEGDDLFAGYVQKYAESDEVIGISGDKDFVQLLKHKNFKLINPDNGKQRTVLDACGVDDPLFFMFEKAMRGDKGDNVFPAYPRVRKQRLLKCMEDEYELTKIMNESWFASDQTDENGNPVSYTVKDLFEENILLMDLEAQPEHIRHLIDETIDHASANRGQYSFVKFNKFCGQYGLTQISENSVQFSDFLNCAPVAKKKSALVF
jgi:hypothetical protein